MFVLEDVLEIDHGLLPWFRFSVIQSICVWERLGAWLLQVRIVHGGMQLSGSSSLIQLLFPFLGDMVGPIMLEDLLRSGTMVCRVSVTKRVEEHKIYFCCWWTI